MIKELPISEVRRNLSGLLKKIRKDRGLTIRITLNGMAVGDLSAPREKRLRMNAGEALLRAAREIGPPEVENPSGISVAEEHDRFLY